jgi:hypothetical protein
MVSYSAQTALSVTHSTFRCDLEHADKPLPAIEKDDALDEVDLMIAWATYSGGPLQVLRDYWSF